MAQSLQDFAAQVAQQFGLDPNIFNAQIMQESSFNPNAVNGSAQGIAQFQPGTAAQYGLTNPFDPYAAITAAGQMDANLLAKNGGDYTAMLTSYGTLSNKPGTLVGPGSSIYQNFQDIISGIAGGAGSNATATNDPFGAASALSAVDSFNGSKSPIAAGFKWLIDYATGEGANIVALVLGVMFIGLGVYGLVSKPSV